MHATAQLPMHRRSDTRDVIYVLLLVQGAMGLLAGMAMLLFSGGNPLVWPVAFGTPVLLFVLASGVVRNRRRSRRIASIVEYVILVGFVVSLLIGLHPQVDFSLNLLTLITNLVLPIALIRMLRRVRAMDEAISAADAAQVGGLVPEAPGGDPVFAPSTHGRSGAAHPADPAISRPRRGELVRTDWN